VPVAVVRNTDISAPNIPLPGLGIVTLGITDRDVILARADIAASASPVTFPCSMSSLDGCNYDIVAVTPDLPILGMVAIERGFVGVDVTIDGKDYRFVTTHLEVMEPEPGNPLSSAIQAAQASQLITTLATTTPPGRSLIVVGDINSSPDDPIIPGSPPISLNRAKAFSA
jgi:hypothetical protein